MGFFRKADLPATEMLPGITRRSAYLDDVMITLVDLEAGSVLPEHHHPHQQITFVLSGSMEFTLDGETRMMSAGEGALVPPNATHSAKVLDEPCQALDAWHPVRDDYR